MSDDSAPHVSDQSGKPVIAVPSLPERGEGGAGGVAVIREALKTIPSEPGVYRMLGAKGEVLYVGKALSLKKRVVSYTRVAQLPERLRQMVSLTVGMEIVITRTEAEALLLEANYIKRMKPRFNILLRDDKSYPWLMMTGDHPFPRVARQRGKPTKKATYWGPFASARSVDQTLKTLQKAFLLRTCTDSVFTNRTRPCLLHQIKRCCAPCVGRVTEEDYAALALQARQFLSKGSRTIQETLAAEMEQAAEAMDYERAATIRDRIRGLVGMRSSSVVNPGSIEEADVVAIWQSAGRSCIQVFFIRGGRNNGNRAFYPVHASGESAPDVLSAFLVQFYDDKRPPAQILVNHVLAEDRLLEEALTLHRGKKVRIFFPQRGEKKDVLDHAVLNAREALERKLAETLGQKALLEGVAAVIGLEDPPQRIEVYDNSHMMGQAPYGVMIVAGAEGFVKRAYRKYRIKGPVAPGDDFAMMREVITRRFGRASAAETAEKAEDRPDLLLIDGGKGQVSAVRQILAELGVTDVRVAGIAKGVDRNAGREWFFLEDREPFQLPPRDPVLYYLQRLRDEAHRFAITTHRAGRAKKLVHSGLDDVPGVGAVRKKALLTHFGSVRSVRQAGLEELSAVPGISSETAEAIYGYFHPDWVREQGVSGEKTQHT